MSKSADADAPTNKHHPVTSYASPPYRAELKDFDYELKKGGTPWATLTLTADSEISKNFPTFIESTPITGRVTLDLAKPDSITGVEINVSCDTRALREFAKLIDGCGWGDHSGFRSLAESSSHKLTYK